MFYAISLVAVAVFTLLATRGRAFYWERLLKWETWIPGALLALAYVASAFGIDFYRSFWSLFIRGDGLLMLTCAVASFYLILLYADRVFFNCLLRAVAAVATFVSVYGIGEWIIGGGRIGSLLGNAAFFAGYLCVAFFATLAAAQSLGKNWRRAAIGGASLQIVAIVLTATRGTILALALAGVVYLVYVSFSRTSAGSGWARALLATLAILGAIFFVFRADLVNVPFAPIARIASISTADPDVASRLFIWKNMLSEIEKSPWLGVGAEHIDVLFNHFYDPTKIGEQWFDRSHNAFLDYAAQYGIGGLLLYLALIAAFFSAALRFARIGEKKYTVIFSLLALSYAIQNFFVFDTVSSFWLFLALLAVLLAQTQDSPSETLYASTLMRLASWPIALALVLLVIPFSIRPALAAYNLSQGYKFQLIDVPKETDLLSHGIALGTYGDIEYGYVVYDMYTDTQMASLSGQALDEAYQTSLSILTSNFNRYPYDARTALYLAHVLSLAPPGISVDQSLLSSTLERVIRLSTKRYQAWYILVNLSIGEANTHAPSSPERIAGYTAARDLMSRYVSLVPTLAEPHFVLAQLLYASSDTTGAAIEAAKGRAVYKEDLKTAISAVTYYENALDLTNAAFFLKEIIHLDPTNTAAASDLEKIQTYEKSRQ
jgi:O-antigen ligase